MLTMISKPKFFDPVRHAYAKAKRRKKALKLLRARDGDTCWRCGHPMRFDGAPNCGKAATIEHRLPLSKGGSWALENLCLCHVGCNRHLGAHPPEQKERMRCNRNARPDTRAGAPKPG
ncbi:HNH endonuclease [Novosphingopyxis sp.]|uniref:HNH endonuclease n=1 Tax=Novosphingopyxis sp. TaxID=2709690 RepID=UPI003B5B1267